MRKEFITESSKQTKKLGEILAKELKNGGIIALSGDLGAGKTTFTQGFLKGLKVKGPYTSPTFLVIKNYKKEISSLKPQTSNLAYRQAGKFQSINRRTNLEIKNIYHIDTYRVNAKDILNLGWKEIIANPKNIVIIEWADRIKRIIPKSALWIKFEWVDENKRKIGIN